MKKDLLLCKKKLDQLVETNDKDEQFEIYENIHLIIDMMIDSLGK